ncbi:MAG: cation:proton antiporter [Melioribacteraceae bacterium]|nr:cation:proton antiporter [Melioribacteraceae bacterium]WKZ70363.1 MAG: cation:proton antiporter [Melioribacteraceae bacterium]
MKLTANEITFFLIGIAVMLLFARVFGEIVRKLNQPFVIGEIIAGIILGPTLLGTLFPEFFNSLFVASENVQIAQDGLIQISVILLLLVSGLEIDLALVLKQGPAAVKTSLASIIIPFAVGFGFAFLAPQFLGIEDSSSVLVFALFIGTALSITALPVVVKTLMDLNIFRSKIGSIIISSAMVNDLIGWIIFSIILSMIGTDGHGLGLGNVIIITFVFIIFFLTIGKKIFDIILPKLKKHTIVPGGIINLVLITGFLGSAFTEYIGIHAIFGAFIIGIAIGDSAHLDEKTRNIIHEFVTNIFAPLFFVSIGLRVNFLANFDLLLVLIFLILAFVGKVVGGYLGSKISGFSRNDSMIIGFGMNSRGAMEIVLGTLALQFGLIQEKVFVALVIMALFTSISSAPLMNIFLRKSVHFISFKKLIRKDLIYFTKSKSKTEVIKELSEKIAAIQTLDSELIFSEILKREVTQPTGIANGLAIPHTKLNIKNSVVAIAISKNGIDFSSFDNKPANIIVMLLTPRTENEIQLKLLAEIASLFETDELTNELCLSESVDDAVMIIGTD